MLRDGTRESACPAGYLLACLLDDNVSFASAILKAGSLLSALSRNKEIRCIAFEEVKVSAEARQLRKREHYGDKLQSGGTKFLLRFHCLEVMVMRVKHL